jgi:uncharacterized protein YbaA (DUF1428 family)
MAYVDGFLIPVPAKNLAAYRRMARLAGKIWREHGALDYKECAGDDLKPKGGNGFRPVPFGKIAGTKPGETVVFSYIVYRSRADRDRVNAKVMKDPRMQKMPKTMPFDPNRMAYGGFKVIVDA